MTTSPVSEPRPAATVMLARDGERGLEVFMLRRTAGAAFAAGFYVFPGGKVDPDDGGAAINEFSPALDDATASAALDIDSGGLAYWVAAIRECFEEAGLLLAHGADGSEPTIDAADRERVHQGALSLVALCERDNLRLDTGLLRYVAHWVTPVGEARRFDTRFFLAPAPPDQDGSHDDGETVESRWVRPTDALALADAGELLLLPPTRACLGLLADSDTVADAFAAADAAGPPPRIEPVLQFDDAGNVVGVRIGEGKLLPLNGAVSAPRAD